MTTRNHSLLLVWPALVAGATSLSCAGSSATTGGNPAPGALIIVQGDRQSGLVSRTLPTSLRVSVLDGSGKPLGGITVTWTVTAGGGTVSASGPTTSAGLASATWSLGPGASENSLEASVSGVSPVRFTATGISPQSAIALEAWLTPDRSPTEILLINPDGHGYVNLTHHQGDDGEPAWSPDRSRIAFKSNRDGRSGFVIDYDLYVMNSDGTGVARLTTAEDRDVEPDWSPDGARIAFSSIRNGDFDIYVMNADGSNQVRLTTDPGGDENPDWSPDGSRILFATTRFGNREIAVMNADGTGLVRLTNDPAEDDEPTWSPDGTKVAFATNRFLPGGPYEVAVMNADGSGVTRLATHTGNENDYGPTWSPDGSKIAYTCWRRRSGVVFSEVCTMNADGTGEVRLTYPGLPWASWAAWRP